MIPILSPTFRHNDAAAQGESLGLYYSTASQNQADRPRDSTGTRSRGTISGTRNKVVHLETIRQNHWDAAHKTNWQQREGKNSLNTTEG